MKEEFEDFLSEQEKSQFANLPREKSPPNFLEEAIMKNLKKENLIHTNEQQGTWSFFKLATAFATAFLILAFGIAIGFWLNTDTNTLAENKNPQYILLLRSDSSPQATKLSNDEITRRVKEYTSWANELSEKGTLISAEKLKSKTEILDKNAETSLSANDDAVVGFFVIKAENYEKAKSVAKDSPHLKYGGRVEVREIDKGQ